MTRDELKERLLKAGLPEEVVDAKLESVSDEDLVRMKDIPTAMTNDTAADGHEESDIVLDDSVMKEIGRVVSEALKEYDYGIEEVEVEMPEVQQLVKDVAELKEIVGKLVATLDEISKSDEERLKEMNGDLSPAQRLRIRYNAGDAKPVPDTQVRKERKPEDGVIVDGEGRMYDSISALVFG